MVTTTTITSGTASLLGTFGTLVTDNIYVILGVAVLLIGAGWAWSRFKKHVHGRKI